MNDLVEVLRSKSAHDPALRALLKSIDSGKANFRDTAQYSIRYSHQLGNILSENVLDIPPDVRETAAEELLKYGYDDMNTILAEVQKSLDEQAGIHIRPQKADFPSERVRQFTHSLVDTTVTDSVIQRRARAGSETITKSFHDSFIKKNAQFRNDAGLKCYITREGSNCCKWCSEVAGRYEFGSQPSDIFRRHDNCDCTIDYDGQKLRGKLNADGSRSKTWEEIPDADGKYEPKVLSETDARAAEQRNLSQFRGVKINSSSIDNGRGSGIIEARESMFRTFDDPMREVMGSAYENNREELFAIIDELESKGVEVDISESNNTMGYQPSPNMSGGSPGRVKMHRDSSLSAWEHERQHVYDDEKSGWNGRAILTYDMNEHYQWEVRAYEIEIRRAENLGRQDIVERLEQLLENERKAIFDE